MGCAKPPFKPMGSISLLFSSHLTDVTFHSFKKSAGGVALAHGEDMGPIGLVVVFLHHNSGNSLRYLVLLQVVAASPG